MTVNREEAKQLQRIDNEQKWTFELSRGAEGAVHPEYGRKTIESRATIGQITIDVPTDDNWMNGEMGEKEECR